MEKDTARQARRMVWRRSEQRSGLFSTASAKIPRTQRPAITGIRHTTTDRASTKIKADIVAVIKAESDLKLRYGYKWNGMTVEYSEALKTDLTGMLVAIQGGMMQFPVEVNLGSQSDGTPQVYPFSSLEELGAVAAGIAAHRAQVSKEEWAAIQALGDMEEYSEVQ